MMSYIKEHYDVVHNGKLYRNDAQRRQDVCLSNNCCAQMTFQGQGS